MNTQKPAVNQLIEVRGVVCRIIKIHPFGTVDVESLCGKHAWRLSGLRF